MQDCAGILLLDSVDLKKADKDMLGSALSRGLFDLKQAPSLPVPATAAVWLLHSGDNVVKGSSAPSPGSLQQVIQQSAQHLGAGLFAAFDLVLPHSNDAESHDTDDYLDSILDRTACQGDQSHMSMSGRQSQPDGNATRQQASMMLKGRLAKSVGMPMPCISSEALMMMQCYYALLRQQHQAVGTEVPGMAPGTYTVTTLMRMASASARLHLRQDVTTMPDAVLAIYMLQKSMKAKVGWSCCTRACCALHIVSNVCRLFQQAVSRCLGIQVFHSLHVNMPSASR